MRSLGWYNKRGDPVTVIVVVVVAAAAAAAVTGTIELSVARLQNCTGEPCMYGICMNNNNNNSSSSSSSWSYSCYCIDGYTGINCEINWDDCWSDPCVNGGTCHDAVASYNCTCPDGFVGTNCQEKYSECMNEPCLNNGTCIVDYNNGAGFMCQCPEGYSGDYCEIDASVCNKTICRNSGECVEGPGLYFTCRCGQGWTGAYCEEDLNECLDYSPCLNGGLCLNLPASYTCACLFGYTGKDCDKAIVPCDENPCKNEAMCLLEDEQPVCYCVPDYHGQLCELRYDDCQSKFAACQNGATCIDGINNFTCSCPPNYYGDTCHHYRHSPASSSPPSPSPATTFTSLTTEIPLLSLPTIIYQTAYSASPNYDDDTTPFDVSTDAATTTTSSSSSTLDPSQTTTTNDYYYYYSSEETSTDSSLVVSERESPEPTTATSIAQEDETWSIVAEHSTMRILVANTTSPVLDVSNDFSSDYNESLSTTMRTEDVTEKKRRYNCSSSSSSSSREECVTNAAFNGKSYLRQQVELDAEGSLRIFIRLKSKSKSGVILHGFFDDQRYVLLYMQAGQLKFQFSCGLQTMLLGEIDSPINNGYDVDLEIRFQYSESKTCSAILLVNETMAMSGKQLLTSYEDTIVPRRARLHLGGIPQAFAHYFPRIAMGFVGCMSILRVNDKSRHFIRDSSETHQIEECTSFLCLINPCRNFGSCHDIDGQLYCKCIAGFSGAVCERTACDDNPCYLGATCISSPGAGFICVCPLGMHGLLCEEESRVVQASFSVFIPGFSSYAAYGLTSPVRDAMELRMSFLPHSLDQISLIAFMGQTGGGSSARTVTDHFSITYVRGYIMLTWDLGSGVRRIFTKSPVKTLRNERAHTLRVGRRGRDAWLSVDRVGNVTGQAAGTMSQLDVSPVLYIGGHKSRNFEALPHDLPLHTGFYGCIFDIELKTDDSEFFRISESSPATGRGVGECRRNECTHNACKNGALCLNHGPTYSCVCMKEWQGPDCSIPAATCSSSLPYKCHHSRANVSL